METVFLYIYIKETDERPDFQIRTFANFDSANATYNNMVENLRKEAERFANPHEVSIAENKYRKFEIYDLRDANYVTVEIKEVKLEGAKQTETVEKKCCMSCSFAYHMANEPCRSCYMYSNWKKR